MNYQPADRLHLWLLTQPRQPVLVGDISLVRTSQGVSLSYAESWLRSGFALSEDLPLIDQEFLPTERGSAAGAVDDARPDRWGERVILRTLIDFDPTGNYRDWWGWLNAMLPHANAKLVEEDSAALKAEERESFEKRRHEQ